MVLFGAATIVTVLLVYLCALKRIYPARRPILACYAVFAFDRVEGPEAIGWAIGALSSIGPVIP